jgi:hypothetical protein
MRLQNVSFRTTASIRPVEVFGHSKNVSTSFQASLGNVPFAKLGFARLVKQSFTEVRSQAELGTKTLHLFAPDG